MATLTGALTGAAPAGTLILSLRGGLVRRLSGGFLLVSSGGHVMTTGQIWPRSSA